MTVSTEAQRRDHLAQVERHIVEAEGRIAHQRRLIERLANIGADTVQAEKLLKAMQQSLDLANNHRAMILSDAQWPAEAS